MLTEAEARKKWCPYRGPLSKTSCITSACMAWRWQHNTMDFTLAIEATNLSVRIKNCLYYDGIKTVGDLAKISEVRLRQVPNLGGGSIKEIKNFLAELGIALLRTDQHVAEEKKYIESTLTHEQRGYCGAFGVPKS